MYQWLVFNLCCSKYCPYKNIDDLWGMPWNDFIGVIDWVNFSMAQEYAMTKDAHAARDNK
jgi:hypothetical protein